jgi:hypothetical protein
MKYKGYVEISTSPAPPHHGTDDKPQQADKGTFYAPFTSLCNSYCFNSLQSDCSITTWNFSYCLFVCF